MKYSLQRNKLHPIKGIIYIVLFLVSQGNLKEQKENWLSNSLPILQRQNKTFYPRRYQKSVSNKFNVLAHECWVHANQWQERASQTNSVSILTASCTISWTCSESSCLCNKLQAIAMHNWLIINLPKSHQSSKTNRSTLHTYTFIYLLA